MDYHIAEARSSEELEEKVRDAIFNGWLLQGGVSVMPLGDDNYVYVQAMTRMTT